MTFLLPPGIKELKQLLFFYLLRFLLWAAFFDERLCYNNLFQIMQASRIAF